MNNDYELILGLEIHIQLNTSHKMFCGCVNDPFNAEKPNMYTCPVCLGLPGGLPIPNKDALKKAQILTHGLGSKLNGNIIFERKNYSYPDLAKGYQITCPHYPIGIGGECKYLSDGKELTIRFREIHLEEDTAKSSHKGEEVLIDFNKSGVPLLEIVTEPDFRDIEEAVDYCKHVQLIARYLNCSDADMEKGNMRLEANISMRKKGESDLPNYRVELKNINSYGFMRKALKHEMQRQVESLIKGETLSQETRGFDELKGVTFVQRSKEDAHDYRYFPDPDIPVINFSELELKSVISDMPELPNEKAKSISEKYGIGVDISYALCITHSIVPNVDFESSRFLELVSLGMESRRAANLIINNAEYKDLSVSEIYQREKEKESSKISSEDEIGNIIDKIITENEKAVLDYHGGNDGSIQFLVGQVMKDTKGKADAGIVIKILKEKLASR